MEMMHRIDASFRPSIVRAVAFCEAASTLGGVLGALGFAGLLKAMAHTWDLAGVGQMAFWGALFGILVGVPLTTIMTLTVFKPQDLSQARIWGYWAITCLFIYGGLGSFMICVAWLAWCL